MSGAACAARSARVAIVVGVGDMHVTSDPAVTLITYALGSCLGIAVHDPVAGVGGMLHAMLPSSALDAAKAQAKPSVFVDTGVPALFRACYERGASKHRLVVKVAGAATANGTASDHFQIGRRNALMARQLFWKNNVLVRAEDVGGSLSRTMRLHVGSGAVIIRVGGDDIEL